MPRPTEKGNAPEVAATGASRVQTQPIKEGFNVSHSTEVATTSAIATPDLSVVDGQITTTSRQIAEHFGKPHKTVLRAIRNLLQELPEEHQRNFVPMLMAVEVGGGAVRQDPAYRITRDGFTLLAMGFTGKEAMQWKVAYLTAFNKMEQELLARTTRPANPALDYDRISPAQAQDLKELVEAIVKAGIQSFPETWARLHRKFRVNSYLELPAARFHDARDYLLGKLPEDAPPIDATDAPALVAARKVAEDYFDALREAHQQGRAPAFMAEIPPEVLQGLVAKAVMSQRVLTWFDYTTGEMRCKLVPSDASTVSFTKDSYQSIVERIPMDRIPDMLAELTKRVGCHIGAFSQHLRRDRMRVAA